MKKELQDLLDTDRKFCQECSLDKEEAWMKYMASDSIMGTASDNAYIKNQTTIKESIARLFQLENISFTWEPEFGFVSDDNTLGVTTGFYERTYTVKGKTVSNKGKYTTVWIRENNQWKVAFDIGN